MLEVLRQDYIRTARSKGLMPRVIFFKHALRDFLPAAILTKTKHGFSDDYTRALKAQFTTLNAAQLQHLATELVLRRHLPTGNWGGWMPEHDVTCKHFGIDRKKLEAAVVKERAAAAAAKKAAKKTSKKKAAKKAKRRGAA